MDLKRRLFLCLCDPMRFLSQRVSTTVEMPLAHPISTTTSSNFGPEPFLVVKFITADPGEAFADFSYRTEHPGKTQWGQRGASEHKTELASTATLPLVSLTCSVSI